MKHEPLPRPGEPAAETTRQTLVQMLVEREHGFETLVRMLRIRPQALATELRHVERSVRAQGRRLKVTPPRCLDCDFVFREREARHLHPPSRCPKCRGEQIADPLFRIVD